MNNLGCFHLMSKGWYLNKALLSFSSHLRTSFRSKIVSNELGDIPQISFCIESRRKEKKKKRSIPISILPKQDVLYEGSLLRPEVVRVSPESISRTEEILQIFNLTNFSLVDKSYTGVNLTSI